MVCLGTCIPLASAMCFAALQLIQIYSKSDTWGKKPLSLLLITPAFPTEYE